MKITKNNKIEIFGQTFKFVTSSLLCYCLEYLLYLFFLNFVTFMNVSTSNIVCRVLACTANYLINKNVVFKSKKTKRETAIKYLVVHLSVLALSTLLISLFNGISYTENDIVAKYVKLPVDCGLFFLSYTAQKKWVFKDQKSSEDESSTNENDAGSVDGHDDYDGGEDV